MLATATKNLPKAQRAEGKPVSRIATGPRGLYTVTKPGGKPLVLGVMAWRCATARLRNTQSATGILYIVVVFCFLGELTGQLLLGVTHYFL